MDATSTSVHVSQGSLHWGQAFVLAALSLVDDREGVSIPPGAVLAAGAKLLFVFPWLVVGSLSVCFPAWAGSAAGIQLLGLV